jgi:hypothetical protein
MTEVRCKTCRFFTQAQVMGLCRRYPETQNKHEMDWCGEHQLSVVLAVPVVTPEQLVERKKPGRKPKHDVSDPSAA